MNSLGRIITLLLAIVVLLDCVHAQTRAVATAQKKKSSEVEVTSQAMDELFAKWNKPDSPGVAVAVQKESKLIFKRGYGSANLEYSVPVTPKTVFHIASVSKQFTTFSVMLLEERGKLSLDDDIRKHIPEVPDFGSKITLKHLANHTSGLRDQWSLLTMAGWRMDDVITRDHIMQLVSNQRELNFLPGSEHVYCNTGYTLLAEVVARVSGKSFAEFTKANIFDPLGMHNTLFYDNHERIVPNRAYSYKRRRSGWVKSVLSYANVGATSLFTTAEDLSKWAANFDNPSVGSRKIMDQMKTQAVLNNGKKIDYALGQVVRKYRGLSTISHGGADAGYRAILTRVPEQKFSVVLLSNDGSFNASSVSNKVLDLFLSDKLTKRASPAKEKKVDRKTLKKYVGKYRLHSQLYLAVTEDDGSLFARGTGQSKFKLKSISSTKFVFEPAKIEIDFKIDKADGKPEMSYKQRTFRVKTKPATDSDVFKPKSAEYEGIFHSPELSTEYKFTVENDKLTIEHFRHGKVWYRAESKNLFTTRYLGKIKFIRDKNDAVTGFTASSGRVRNLRFEKKQN